MNAGALSALRAARSQHHPATLYFGCFPSRDPGVLIPEDLALAHALQVYEDDLCPGCGQPSRIAHTDLGDGEFSMDDGTTCRACAARDRYRREHEKSEPRAGQVVRLVAKWFLPKAAKRFTPTVRRGGPHG